MNNAQVIHSNIAITNICTCNGTE